MGARRQTFAHKQRMPTRQGGIDKYAFRTPFVGHFVDYKQCHCRLGLRYSQSEAGIIREEFTRDFTVSNDANNHGNQSENALMKEIQSSTRVITKFESLVGNMSCADNAM